jgi:hypothetical protein
MDGDDTRHTAGCHGVVWMGLEQRAIVGGVWWERVGLAATIERNRGEGRAGEVVSNRAHDEAAGLASIYATSAVILDVVVEIYIHVVCNLLLL